MILTILDPRSGQKVSLQVEDVPAVRQGAPAKIIAHPSARPAGPAKVIVYPQLGMRRPL